MFPTNPRQRRRPRRFWAIALLVAVWTASVLGAYYQQLARLVLHPLGLTAAADVPHVGGFVLPDQASLSRIAQAGFGVIGVLFLAWGALALGSQLLRVTRLSREGRPGEALTATALGLGAISYTAFVLALAGFMRSGVLTALLLVLVLNAAVWTFRRRREFVGRLAEARRRLAIRGTGNGRLFLLAGFLVTAAFLLVALVAALGPEVGFDALWYHLELPRTYLDAGGFVRLPEEFVSLYPQTAELLYAVGLDWGGVVSAKLVDLLFGLLLLLVTYRLARRFVSHAWAVLAVALVLAAPVAHWEFTTAYVDLATGFFATAALLELVRWRDELDRARVVRAALLLGLALATKHLALFFLPGAIAIVALPLARPDASRPGSRISEMGLRAGAVAREWKMILIFPFLALLVATPWYARAAVITGDPFFPSLFPWLGAPANWYRHATYASLQVYLKHFGFGRSTLDVVVLPWRLVSSPGSFGGSIGPFFLIGMPLLAFSARVRRSGLWVVGLFALSFFVLWASPLSSFQARFLIPVLPAFAVLAASGLSACVAWLRLSRLPRIAAAVPIAILAVLLLSLPPFIPWHANGRIGYALTEVNLAAAVDPVAAQNETGSQVHGYWAIDYANHHVARGERILSLLEGGQYYSRNLRLVDYAPLAKPTTYDSAFGKEEQVYEALRSGGLSYVLVDRTRADLQQFPLPILGERFTREYLRLLFEDDEAALYAVKRPDEIVRNLPEGFEESVVFERLTQPTSVAFAPDGRVFVAEKAGTIKVFDAIRDTAPTIFADLRSEVDDVWERGLLGIALDPAFPTRPYVYVSYTHDGAACAEGSTCTSTGRVSRLTAHDDVMTAGEKVLVEDWCQQFPSHSMGAPVFGPNGTLYVAGGEGAGFAFVDHGQRGDPPNPCGDPVLEGGALRSQDVRTSGDATGLSGTVIRISPATGRALHDNPRAADPDANAARIVAYGLRNPFRMAFRPGTSELWLGDVGWEGWEEIDVIPNPASSAFENFGWPCFEGPRRQAGYAAAGIPLCESLYNTPESVSPAFYEYAHGGPVVSHEPCPTEASALSGLAFAHPGAYPAEYKGALFFSDYNRDCIWVMRAGADGMPDPASLSTFAAFAANPVDLQFGPGGDLYYVDLDGGTIRRISYAGT